VTNDWKRIVPRFEPESPPPPEYEAVLITRWPRRSVDWRCNYQSCKECVFYITCRKAREQLKFENVEWEMRFNHRHLYSTIHILFTIVFQSLCCTSHVKTFQIFFTGLPPTHKKGQDLALYL
jgi:hypothetical protein